MSGVLPIDHPPFITNKRFIVGKRAFIVEVELEKIAERTMCGKAERARSGKLPQATGKGIYGYRYDKETGKREVVGDQAEVIQRMFTQFVGGASIVGLANSLNEEGIRTFTGKKWSPATIFHMLKNETYAGRTVYRRTKATVVRDHRTGQKHRRVQVRGPEEWVEIPDAIPPIVDMETFQATQSRLQDPKRLRRGRRESSYTLSGRIRCIDCGRADLAGEIQALPVQACPALGTYHCGPT